MRATGTAGNTEASPASYTWTITRASTSYTSVRFFQPVDNPPVINTVNSGQTIPQKWQLFDAATGQPVSDPTSFVSFTSYQVSCTTWTGNHRAQQRPARISTRWMPEPSLAVAVIVTLLFFLTRLPSTGPSLIRGRARSQPGAERIQV